MDNGGSFCLYALAISAFKCKLGSMTEAPFEASGRDGVEKIEMLFRTYHAENCIVDDCVNEAIAVIPQRGGTSHENC